MPPVPGAGDTIYIKFTTRDTTGLPTVLTGSPAISIYKNADVTQSTAGVTLIASFDSVVGLNHITVDTDADGAFYTNGDTFYAVITTGTVGGVSVVGEVVGNFNLAAADPTVAQVATAVWQDATAGDFTVASSIGKALYIANVAPGAAGGHFISGSNAGTTTFGALTVTGATTFTGAVTHANTTTYAGAVSHSSTTTYVGAVTYSSTTTYTGAVLHSNTTTYTGAVTYSALVSPFMIRTATAQAGNANSITLDASASATSDLYKGETIELVSGSGAGQARVISNYNGATKVATVDRSWTTAPSNTSVFVIWPTNSPSLNNNLQVTANVVTALILSGTAQAGSTANTIVLAAAASSTNNIYVGDLVTISGGTGLGQSRTIIAYNGTSKVATVDRNWNTTPDGTSTFNVFASTTPSAFSDQGVAQAGAATTITIQSTASAVDDLYNGSIVTILSGTGSGQTREVTNYVGATKVATVDIAWSVNPDSTSAYAVIPTVSATGGGTFQDVNVATWAGAVVSASSEGNPLMQLADACAHGGTLGSSTATFALQTAEWNATGVTKSGLKCVGGNGLPGISPGSLGLGL